MASSVSAVSAEQSVSTHNRIIVASCNLDQWALDFDGNLKRILRSCDEAKAKGARMRVGPEMEITGYSCEDHFMEMDTFLHSEQSLAAILQSEATVGLLCDFGCPVLHGNVRYNCRIFCLDKKILLIRPKAFLANDGNYHEPRFFTSWKDSTAMHEHVLSDLLREATQQRVVPFGMACLQTAETRVAAEVCEELWTPNPVHVNFALAGVEIFTNGSGSHHQLRKLNARLGLIRNAMSKCGGVYIYANQRGCDGSRLYFDGCSLICLNGFLLAQAAQFGLKDVEVVSALIDLDDVRAYRNATGSLQEQSSFHHTASPNLKVPVVDCLDGQGKLFSLRIPDSSPKLYAALSTVVEDRIHLPEQECALGPASWLWDYMRRSGAKGFLLPLSGGADSGAVAAICRVMCDMAANEGYNDLKTGIPGDEQVRRDIHRLAPEALVALDAPLGPEGAGVAAFSSPVRIDEHAARAMITSSSDRLSLDVFEPPSPLFSKSMSTVKSAFFNESTLGMGVSDENKKACAKLLCNALLHTVYMGTENSSLATSSRARRLATFIGAYHSEIRIDLIVTAVLSVFHTLTSSFENPKPQPRYISQGGTPAEDLALQNIQARLRMVMAYLCAQLFPWVRQKTGFLLVLGSANVDEALRGYMTKYDCSSADINPIGGISKGDLKSMMTWAARTYGLDVLDEITSAPPTAELRPIAEGEQNDYTQNDEEDMGMSYKELGIFGMLRKVYRCGPVSMYRKLLEEWVYPKLKKDLVTGLEIVPKQGEKNINEKDWPRLTEMEVAKKVERFFFYYSVNRHKMTTLTPSYHAENYSPDDNRFDFRPFLYNTKWTRQFATMNALVAKADAAKAEVASRGGGGGGGGGGGRGSGGGGGGGGGGNDA